MTITPTHISYGDWLSAKYDEIAVLSLASGISVQDARDGAVLNSRIHRAIADVGGAEVIPFPGMAVRAAQ